MNPRERYFDRLAKWIVANTKPSTKERIACLNMMDFIGEESNKTQGNKKDYDPDDFRYRVAQFDISRRREEAETSEVSKGSLGKQAGRRKQSPPGKKSG